MKQAAVSFNGIAEAARRNKKFLLSSFRHVLKRGVFLNGPEVASLERKLGQMFGRGRVITLASGHDAIFLSLKTLKLTDKDEVIFPVNAYPTAFPIVLSGARPVPVDVDKNGQLDPQKLEDALTEHTKVVVVVHLYGLVGQLNKIKAICRTHRLTLIEDAAQAFGSRDHGRLVGTIGDIGCFSFYPTKNLGAPGDGGAVWTKKKNVFEYVKAARSYGEETLYQSLFPAGHSRLPELQVAALQVSLRRFRRQAKARQRTYDRYLATFGIADLFRFVRPLRSIPGSDPVPHLFVIEAKSRDLLATHLAQHGISTMIHYPTPVHLVPAFRFLGKRRGDFPMAERLSKNILSLPFHPYLTRAGIERVVATIAKFYHL